MPDGWLVASAETDRRVPATTNPDEAKVPIHCRGFGKASYWCSTARRALNPISARPVLPSSARRTFRR